MISNCVINLSADKGQVIREAARVLRPGGRFVVSDVIADDHMDTATRSDMEQWTGCIAGALTRGQFEHALADASFVDLEIRESTASTSTQARPSSAPANPHNARQPRCSQRQERVRRAYGTTSRAGSRHPPGADRICTSRRATRRTTPGPRGPTSDPR